MNTVDWGETQHWPSPRVDLKSGLHKLKPEQNTLDIQNANQINHIHVAQVQVEPELAVLLERKFLPTRKWRLSTQDMKDQILGVRVEHLEWPNNELYSNGKDVKDVMTRIERKWKSEKEEQRKGAGWDHIYR